SYGAGPDPSAPRRGGGRGGVAISGRGFRSGHLLNDIRPSTRSFCRDACTGPRRAVGRPCAGGPGQPVQAIQETHPGQRADDRSQRALQPAGLLEVPALDQGDRPASHPCRSVWISVPYARAVGSPVAGAQALAGSGRGSLAGPQLRISRSPPQGTVMRIGLIRRRHALAGGAEQTVARLAGEFVARGHAVTVVAERWAAQLPVGVSRHVIPSLPGPEALRMLIFGLRAGREARGVTAEVVLTLDRTPGADVFRAGDGCPQAWLPGPRAGLGGP